jgi:fumiquinazoline A oxidase
VKFAARLSIPFLATGGGHGFATTLGKLQNGIDIDLGFFKNISIDAAASTMTVGGAVLFRDIFEPLYKAGKEIRLSTRATI